MIVLRGVNMNTAEMWVKAQKDSKVYGCIGGDMAYSKKHGLTEKDNFNKAWGLEAWREFEENGLDDLMRCEWEEIDTIDNVMTIKEAERRFGIKIVGY